MARTRTINIADPCLGQDEAKAVYDVVKSGWLYEGKKTGI